MRIRVNGSASDWRGYTARADRHGNAKFAEAFTSRFGMHLDRAPACKAAAFRWRKREQPPAVTMIGEPTAMILAVNGWLKTEVELPEDLT